MTLKRTLDQVRDIEVSLIGVRGPTSRGGTPWWALADPTSNDCVGAQLYCLGLRGRADFEPHFISISAFRNWAGWDEPAVADLQSGDLVLENWNGGRTAEHMEFVYSIDHAAERITTISANTSPAPGVKITYANRGMWKKTRPLTAAFLVGVRPPYADAAPSKARKLEVQYVATFVAHDPATPLDAPTTAAPATGVEDHAYWWLVQTWGRAHGFYGPTFKIDGVPGPRTRAVEAIIYAKAKGAHKA